MYLWLVAAFVTVIFATIMFMNNNMLKAFYLLALTFLCGFMFTLNRKRIKNIKQ